LVDTDAAAIMNPPPRSRPRPTRLLLATAAAALLGVGVASASAASSIEGVWEFGGGQIDIKPAANDTFVGIVTEATKFAECVHPVGQPIWTNMTLQPGGFYSGDHRWYIERTCALNPTLGPTAWRVLEEPDGYKYLDVCFSEPGTTQPTIAANGSSAGVTYKCFDSAHVASLPTGAAEAFKASLPASKRCLSARLFKIHLAEPKYDPFKTVRVTLRGRRLATVRHGGYVVATIDLKGLPPGAFTVKIAATTVLGVHLSGSRTYHTCAKKPKKDKPSKLKASKSKKSH
jgi:hypothetical protein